MMKRLFLLLSLVAALGLAVLPSADAKTDTDVPKKLKADKKKKGAKHAVSGPVGEALSLMTEANIWSGEKPATDADFYIYLFSASWCGPCNMEMPHVVEAYKAMREDGRVELVQISGDQKPENAKGFAEKYGAEFTVLNLREPGTPKLPGMPQPNSIPHATIVDSEGNVIKDGHGALVKSWAQFTIENPDYAGKIGKPGKKGAKKGAKKADKKKKK